MVGHYQVSLWATPQVYEELFPYDAPHQLLEGKKVCYKNQPGRKSEKEGVISLFLLEIQHLDVPMGQNKKT